MIRDVHLVKNEELPIDPGSLPPPGELLDGELDIITRGLAEPEIQPMLQATLSPLRVAFQGEAGAFSEEAIVRGALGSDTAADQAA